MQRRSALALIGLSTIVPAVAFGQEQRPAGGKLGEAAERYLKNTLDVGALALATSKLAQEKAANAWVKRFANYETSEQEGIAKIFSTLGGQPPAPATEDRLAKVRDLRALSGERFEESYLQDQHDGHEQLLHVQDDFIRSGDNPEIADMAKLIRNRVEEHLDLITAIRGELHAYARR